jgi:hypothetical protein
MKFARFRAKDRDGPDYHEPQPARPGEAIDGFQDDFGADSSDIADRDTQNDRPAHFRSIPS